MVELMLKWLQIVTKVLVSLQLVVLPFATLWCQDDANKAGGKWIVRLRKGLASRCWENLLMAMLGEQFMVGDEICGAVISIRFQVGWFDVTIFSQLYQS